MNDGFKMPTVELGLDVYWFQSENHPPYAAKIARFGDRRVDLAVYQPGTAGTINKDGVPHKDDPTRRKEDRKGFWIYSPRTERLNAVLRAMEDVNLVPDKVE